MKKINILQEFQNICHLKHGGYNRVTYIQYLKLSWQLNIMKSSLEINVKMEWISDIPIQGDSESFRNYGNPFHLDTAASQRRIHCNVYSANL